MFDVCIHTVVACVETTHKLIFPFNLIINHYQNHGNFNTTKTMKRPVTGF